MDPEPQPTFAAEITRDVVYAPLGGSGVVEQAVRRLGEAIGLGLLPLGERLPSEAELADRFGIAPMSLREALAVLREAGYVETRRGRNGGTFVRVPVPPQAPDALRRRLAALTVEEITDLYDYRIAVEGAAAALAAARADAEDIADLERRVRGRGLDVPFGEYRAADAAFHVRVAAAARSHRLTAATAEVHAELRDLFTLVPTGRSAMRVLEQQHHELVVAISARDADRARSVAVAHALGSRDLLVGLRLGLGTGAEAPA